MKIDPYCGRFRAHVFVGPPGCGKGSCCKVLGHIDGFFHISTGEIFRSLNPSSPAGALMRSFVEKGLLAPCDVVVAIWRSYLDGLVATNRLDPSTHILLLDGIPRTIEQVGLVAQHADVLSVIEFDAKLEELIDRLKKRALIEGRGDDADIAVVQKRMDVYQKQTLPLLDSYSASQRKKVNAMQSRLAVLRDVVAALS